MRKNFDFMVLVYVRFSSPKRIHTLYDGACTAVWPIGVELIATLFVGSLLASEGLADPKAPGPTVADFDLDSEAGIDLGALELAEIEAEVPAASVKGTLTQLGIGDVPIMIWLVVLLVGFAVVGIGVQLIVEDLLGSDLPVGLATIPAGVFGLWFARRFGPTFTRLMPKAKTDWVPERVLAQRIGVVTQGAASRGRPAEVRVMDRFGNPHYIQAEPLQDRDTLEQGTDVLVLRDRLLDRFVLVGLSDRTDLQSVEQ